MKVFASTDVRNDKLGRKNSGRKSWKTKVTICHAIDYKIVIFL